MIAKYLSNAKNISKPAKRGQEQDEMRSITKPDRRDRSTSVKFEARGNRHFKQFDKDTINDENYTRSKGIDGLFM